MTSEQRQHGLVETVLDLVVYAPLGALDMLRDAPRAVADRRRALEQRVRTARWIGEMAVTVGRQKVTERLSALTAPAAPQPAPSSAPSATSGASSAAAEQPATPEAGAAAGPTTAAAEPFHGYDALPASELVQLLFRLSASELELVRSYEAATRARRTVLAKVDQLLEAA